jgi:hypothetical protein
VIAITELGGMRAAVVLLPVPEDAPPELREGLARRNIVNTGGTCPCGARLTLNRAQRRAVARGGAMVPVQIEHEDDCPATDEALRPEIEHWRSS